ncbi:hypothetical protein PTKIN_Ptkin02bG0061200 [Pterospermum kingtungense]
MIGAVVRFPEDPDRMCYFDLLDIVRKGLKYNSVDRVYFYTPGSKLFDDGLRLIWDDKTTIEMINIWNRYGEIDLYVEHKIDVPKPLDESLNLIGPFVEDSHAFTTTEGKDEVVGGINEGVSTFNTPDTVVGSQKLNEDAYEVVAEKGSFRAVFEGLDCGSRAEGEQPEGSRADCEGPNGSLRDECEGVEGLRVELEEDEGIRAEFQGNGLGAGHNVEKENEGGHFQDPFDDESVYLVRVRYLSDGENDGELQAAREKLRQYKRGKKPVVNETVEGDENDEHRQRNVQQHNYVVGGEGNPVQGSHLECSHSSDNLSLVGSDGEEDSAKWQKSNHIHYNHNAAFPDFSLGMVFRDGAQFKAAIHKYSMLSRKQLKIVKNEPKRVRVKCKAAAKCASMIYASYSKKARGMQVTSFFEEHSCAVSFKNKMVDVKMISIELETDIKDQPKMKLKEIQSRINEKLHVDVNITCAKRVKKTVKEKLTGNFREEFGMLRDYANELLDKNSGSTVILHVDRFTEDSPHVFKRLYICFDALKNGWQKGRKPIIGVDGCFLKGLFQGELLSAVGKDGNHQMYPVAWAVVKVENAETWTWFMELLATDLGFGDGFGYTIMSDKQKGLALAIEAIVPRVEKRNCAHHVFVNWEGHKRPKSMEFAFWNIAKATTERQ